MFEKFGEFDSVAELNKAADGLKREGDINSLKELAAENGIDEDDVLDYLDGQMDDLATVSMAAFGRLYVEEQSTDVAEKMVARVIFTAVRSLCLRESFCVCVMRKGKRAMDIFKAMKEEVGKHKSGNVGVSCGTDRELTNIITAYYTQGEDEMKKLLAALYK